MTACAAITVAAVASNTNGMRSVCGASRKNGASACAGFCRINAPWPR
jgi:hypothetical protein